MQRIWLATCDLILCFLALGRCGLPWSQLAWKPQNDVSVRLEMPRPSTPLPNPAIRHSRRLAASARAAPHRLSNSLACQNRGIWRRNPQELWQRDARKMAPDPSREAALYRRSAFEAPNRMSSECRLATSSVTALTWCALYHRCLWNSYASTTTFH